MEVNSVSRRPMENQLVMITPGIPIMMNKNDTMSVFHGFVDMMLPRAGQKMAFIIGVGVDVRQVPFQCGFLSFFVHSIARSLKGGWKYTQ